MFMYFYAYAVKLRKSILMYSKDTSVLNWGKRFVTAEIN